MAEYTKLCKLTEYIENAIEEAPEADVQPVKREMWITKAEDYYKKWQNSGRSWDDMPYFITGEHIACSECFTEYDVCTEGIEHWIGCPCCLARMDGDYEDELKTSDRLLGKAMSQCVDLDAEAWKHTAEKIDLKVLLGETRPVLKRAYFADPDDTKLANALYDKINELIGRE